LRAGDVVIVDHLTVHQQPAIHAALATVGARLRCLPPSSPDLNPIEQALAKLKAFLRAARPRFTPGECRNFLRHCGDRVATEL
jgi:transposase